MERKGEKELTHSLSFHPHSLVSRDRNMYETSRGSEDRGSRAEIRKYRMLGRRGVRVPETQLTA